MTSESSAKSNGDAADENKTNNERPLWLIIVAALLALLNTLLALPIARSLYPGSTQFDKSAFIAYIEGSTFIGPGIVILLFMIGERFRNFRSILKIFCWASVCVALVSTHRLTSEIAPAKNGSLSITKDVRLEFVSPTVKCGDARVTEQTQFSRNEITLPIKHPAYKLTLPEYPQSSLAAREEGIVAVNIYINESGDVVKASLSRSSGTDALDTAAVKHALEWHLTPGRYLGQSTCSWMTLPVKFELPKK